MLIKLVKGIMIGLILILTFGSNLAFSRSDIQLSSKLSPYEFATKAIASIKQHSSWEKIEIVETEERSYRFALWYKSMPTSMFGVEQDTKAIATSILKELVKLGVDPSKDSIFVSVRAQKNEEEKSVTGKDLVRYFGKTYYDYSLDKLIFEPSN